MLKMRMGRAILAAGSEGAFTELLGQLSAIWKPLIGPLREAQAAALNALPDAMSWGESEETSELYAARNPVVDGEIYVVEDGLLVVTLTRNARGVRYRFVEHDDGTVERVRDGEPDLILRVSAISTGDGAAYLDHFNAMSSALLEVTPEPYYFSSRGFDSLSTEAVAEEIPAGSDYVRAATALASRSGRTAAVAVKSSRGLLESDAEVLLGEGSLRELESLKTAGVVATEAVVVCSSSGSQVARLAEGADLEQLAAQGLKCACGRPINEEEAVNLFSVTPVGSVLLDKSRWMSVLVRERLEALGVPANHILLECQLGASEIDCLALVSGEVTLMELKDKEFSIGAAYSFGAKISITNPAHAIIITTDAVAADVKAHFSRTQSGGEGARYGERPKQTIHYVEGEDFLSGLDRVLGAIVETDVQQVLDSALGLSKPGTESVLRALEARA